MKSNPAQPAANTPARRTARAAACPVCGWRYLLPPTGTLPRCPHCYQAELTLLAENAATLPYVRPPELVIPFRSVADARITGTLRRFSRTLPYPPKDLTPDNLLARLQKIFVPAWLVDVTVAASWQGQVGFEVKTRSHMDKYHESGGWATMEVEKTMLRWEPRMGRMERTYDNLQVPALGFEHRLRGTLGHWSPDSAIPCTGTLLADAYIGLPERLPDIAWEDAEQRVCAAAAQECAEAAGGAQMREFEWTPRYLAKNWTLLLQPLYTTYYYDDEGNPQVIMFHGETGVMSGVKRSSVKKARQATQSVLIFAGLIFIMGVILYLASRAAPEFATLGLIVIGIAVLLGLWGLLPLLLVNMPGKRTSPTDFYINEP